MNTATDADLSWMNNTNVYEVNLRQYTNSGTLKAFAKHLPRLQEMGVETLWFMPLTPISQKEKKELWEVITLAVIIVPSILSLDRMTILKNL